MFLYKRGEIWWFSFRSSGKRIQMSTKQHDYEKAKEAAESLVAPFMLHQQADILMDGLQKVAENLRKTADEDISGRMTFDKAFKNYPTTRKDGLPKSGSTMANARSAWGNFASAMQALGHTTIGDVDKDTGRKYIASLAPRWRQVCYFVLKNVYESNGHSHPFGAKPLRKAGDVQHREPLTTEQVKTLLDTVERHVSESPTMSGEYPLFIRFLLYTGLRIGDAATAKVSQVDYETGILERVMSKTGFRVTFPLHPYLLERIPREGEYLFPRLASYYLHGKNSLSHRIRAFFKEANITGPKQAYCGHCLRTTFASMCAERGVPIAVIQSWLGHTSQEVTRIYARVESIAAKRRALELLPQF